MTGNRFEITGSGKRSPYHPAGRALIEGTFLAIYITGIGRFQAEPGLIRIAMLLGGTVPIRTPEGGVIFGERRDDGHGLWIPVGETRYVIPGRSVTPVLEGKARKAVVMKYEGGEAG